MNNNNKEKYKLDNDKSQLSYLFTSSTKADSNPKSSSDMEISFQPKTEILKKNVYIKELYN